MASRPKILSPSQQLAYDLAGFTHDPLGFAKYAYRWGYGSLEKQSLFTWQANFLDELGQHLRNPLTRHMPFQKAVASGHGIGKTGLIAMLANWGLSTCEQTKIVITAGTGIQLQTKTSPEVSKWFRLAINADWYEINTNSIRFKGREENNLWRMDFITWNAQQTEPFQGLHNRGKRIIVFFDEASAIAKGIWDATEGALTDKDTEIIWVVFSNPTRPSGAFFDCFHSQRAIWRGLQIDSRAVEGATNKAQIANWIGVHGLDSDFVRVRVRGEFPRRGSTQFIPANLVAAARQRKAEGYGPLPKILAVDVARFGDDASEIGLRQGRKFELLETIREKSTTFTGERVIHWINARKPDAVVIDGDGIGGAVVDYLKQRNHKSFEFHGNEAPHDPRMYFNKRAECWGLVRDWLPTAEIPDDAELDEDLTMPEFDYKADGSIILESKDDMKARGMRSPDKGDCLAMTFGVKIAPPKKRISGSTERPTAWG